MGQIKEIPVPDIGDFDEVDVIEVLVSSGDEVAADDPLITLESDKASMEVPSPEAGTVQEVKVSAGDKVAQGAIIVTLEVADDGEGSSDSGSDADEPEEAASDDEGSKEEGSEEESSEEESSDDAEPEQKAQPKQNEQESQKEASKASSSKATDSKATDSKTGGTAKTGGPVDRDIDPESFKAAHASPAVRRYARELGADLSQIDGSGRKGRILKEDVQAYVKKALQGTGSKAPAAAGSGIPPIPAQDFSKFGEIEEQPLSRIRQISAKHLHRSWVNVPHVTQFDEADITDFEDFRKGHKEEAASRGVKLTPVAFLLKACAGALKEFPEFNSSLHPDGDRLILKHYVHIGVAVDTPDGLVVPVIRDVDQKGLYQLAEQLGEVSGRAREGKLTPRDIQGGCFSISSLGGIGGTAFTPIVNAPEVAILGVSRSALKPVYQDGAFVPRLMLPLSLSYDHRVIDGAAAARFIVHLSGLLSDLRRLLL